MRVGHGGTALFMMRTREMNHHMVDLHRLARRGDHRGVCILLGTGEEEEIMGQVVATTILQGESISGLC